MIRSLLDTNIVSEPTRKTPNPDVLEQLRVHQYEMAIASVVWHELVYGLERLPAGRKRDYLSDYLRRVVEPSLPVLDYDVAAAHWHGAERARLEALGRPRPIADGMIAAIAATRNLILVTRNTEDYAPFDGLHLENWFVV